MTTIKHDNASSAPVERRVMRELKPCPFCGGQATLFTDGLTTIMCRDCNITVSNFERSIIKLTDQWNGRISRGRKDAEAVSRNAVDLAIAIERGTKAWADVPNATEFVEDLRSN